MSELKEKDNNAPLTGSAIWKITSDTSLSNQNINQDVEEVNLLDGSKFCLGLTLDDIELKSKIKNHVNRGIDDMIDNYFYDPIKKSNVRDILEAETKKILNNDEIIGIGKN